MVDVGMLDVDDDETFRKKEVSCVGEPGAFILGPAHDIQGLTVAGIRA